MDSRPLGLRPPADDRHLLRYPLTAGTVPSKPTPAVLGIAWYSGFDAPARDEVGHYWIGRGGNWGHVRGGHAICVKPPALRDPVRSWAFYDQGQEGACVGFACCRMMSLLNAVPGSVERYDGAWLYHEAQRIDEWPGESYSGTSLRAGLDVLRAQGPVRLFRGKPYGPHADDGVEANRWATSVEDVVACLHQPASLGYVTLCNSWGRTGYPHFVRLPLEALDRLLREDGEAVIPTDR